MIPISWRIDASSLLQVDSASCGIATTCHQCGVLDVMLILKFFTSRENLNIML